MRIYSKECAVPTTELGKEFLNFVLEEKRRAKENLSMNMYQKTVFLLHDKVRKTFNMPLKVITIGIDVKENCPVIGIFEREPDGKYYNLHFDEENKEYYIEVDD